MTGVSEPWRLGHRPALDGLRGVAVLLVLTTHLGIPGFALAPAVGVAIFFALSGFLITTVLLERDDGLGAFYLRRAARLTPALMACVLLYGLMQIVAVGSVIDRTMMARAITYTANWFHAAGDYSPSSGVAHLWSLAIEEQFYLLWPLLLGVLMRGRRTLRLVLVVAAVLASAALAYSLYYQAGYARAYYGLDARAGQLLAGCWLALLLHRAHSPARFPTWVTTVVLAVTVSLSWVDGDVSVTLIPTGVALLTTVVLWGCVASIGPAWLGAGWLRWVGGRSYGIYLYHLPLQWAASLTGLPWQATAPLVLAVTLGLSEVSWRLIEIPAQRAARRRTSGGAFDREARVSTSRAHQ